MARSRRTLVPAVVVLLALLGGACSNSKKKAAPAPGQPTTTVPTRYALTGLAVTDLPKALRPVLHVKIESSPTARPQSGLDKADLIYEEIAEGGMTRFLAVFQSRDADPLGPIRSVRPTDPAIVAPFGGLFSYSGGTPKFIDLIRKAPIVDVGADNEPGAYTRRSGRVAPENLYSTTPKLYAKAPVRTRPPPPFSRFLDAGQPFAAAGSVPAVHIGVNVGSDKAEYDYDAASRTYKRSTNGTPHVAEGGVRLAPANVIIQFTAYVPSLGDVDTIGSQVMVGQVEGTGDAWVASGGLVVKGKWSKPSASAMTTYTDAAGAPLALTPGQTWVSLPEPAAATGATVR